MMDFKQLASLRQQSSHVDESRHQKSLDCCTQGYAFLAKAQQGGFQNKELLKQACDSLISAIQHNRTNADAYLGMGYLLFLIADYARARSYLVEAERLSPGNADAQAILEQIRTDKVPPKMTGSGLASLTLPPLPVAGQRIDFDALYDQLELQVYATLRMIVSEAPPAATAEPEAVVALEQQHQDLEVIVQAIAQQLTFLDQRLDTSELRNKMKPLEIQLRRIGSVLDSCHKLVEIRSSLAAEAATIAELAVKAKCASNANDVRLLETSLEHLLDFCDQIADELDRLDEKGHSIRSIEPVYESLLARLEDLQDLVDDASERIGVKPA